MSDPETLSVTWGSVPIWVLVSAALNGFLIMQMYTYFRKFFHRDHPALKYTVAIIWVSSTVHVGCAFWLMHNICVAGYYQPTDEITIPLGFSMGFLAQVLINCCVQGIYVSRLFRFSRNAWFLVCLSVPLVVEVGIAIFAAWRVAHIVPTSQVDVWNEEWGWMVTAPFAICASMDAIITVLVCYQLWRSRMSGLKRTRTMVDNLIRWTIQTGLLTSSLALAVVLLKNVQKHSYVWVGISALASDCYANGLLALLNARTSLDVSNTADNLSVPSTILFAGTLRSAGVSAQPESDE